MQEPERSVFFARNLSELFYHMKTIAGLHIVGGCTRIRRLPEKSISTRTIPEMQQIVKHERYIEFGPGVALAEIEAVGERHLPKVLYEAVRGIANPFVRNIATIGGNICAETELADASGTPLRQKLTLYAPLLALDARLELRSFTKTVSLPLQNFTRIPDGHILTNIRVPLNDWDVAVFRRFGPENKITRNSAAFTFLASTEKSTISS
ncbi:MAG: FAD binding domain-containing protein, partial [Treponemataceae bacterium]|nr:FAD binding domain-containing protein [Treponemataceae bacterium]